MTLDDLASLHANDLPGYELILFEEMAFPFWIVTVEALVQKQVPLGVVEEFVLRLAGAGVADLSSMADILGIERELVEDAALFLLKKDLIRLAYPSGQVSVSDRGVGAIEHLRLFELSKVPITVAIDGLTGRLHPMMSADYRDSKTIGNLRLKSVPFLNPATPTTIEFDVLRDFCQETNFLRQDELIDIDGLGNVFPKYKLMRVLVFFNETVNDYKLRVYDRDNRADEYESIIWQMESEHNIRVIPTIAPSIEPSDRGLINKVPREIKESAMDGLPAENSTVDRVEGDSQNVPLTRWLKTWEHRPILMRALAEAKQEICIVSPWLKKGSVDNELLNAMKGALKRGVRIVIRFGLGKRDADEEDVMSDFREIKKGRHGSNLILERVGNTHEKLLVCDRRFVVVGSFNWLSFRGDASRGIRRERSLYLEDPATIEELAKELRQSDTNVEAPPQ